LPSSKGNSNAGKYEKFQPAKNGKSSSYECVWTTERENDICGDVVDGADVDRGSGITLKM